MRHSSLICALATLYLAPNLADILYLEGYSDHENLPGGDNDVRKTPNLPLSTDTNRYSDGVTATSAYDTTSPHFESYRGKPANVSDRYVRYTDYIASAAEQGIAPYGSGDEVREVAKLKIVNTPNYQDLPKPNKTFTVYSAIKWNPSDFAIQEGEEYNITVFGSQSGYSDQFWFDGGLRVNAEGYSSYFDAVSNCYVGMGRCRSHLKKRRRLPSANWMSLACAIGQFVRPITEIEPGQEANYRWLPLDEATLTETIFAVGRSVYFRAVYTGQLICFANDAHTLYWNNYGELKVTVTRESWPPKPNSTYADLKQYACDSAYAVYHNRGNNAELQPVECNLDGGGAGWKEADIMSTTGTFGSGAPEYIFDDLDPALVNS